MPLSSRNILILGTLLALASTPPAQDAKPFLGDWNGNINIANMDIEMTLHLVLDADKKFAGTIDVPTQGAMGLPLADLKIENRTLTFTINGIPGEPPLFKMTLDETGKKMPGTLTQNGMDGTYILTKVEK